MVGLHCAAGVAPPEGERVMSRKDAMPRQFMKKNEVFADVCNLVISDEEWVVVPKNFGIWTRRRFCP